MFPVSVGGVYEDKEERGSANGEFYRKGFTQRVCIDIVRGVWCVAKEFFAHKESHARPNCLGGFSPECEVGDLWVSVVRSPLRDELVVGVNLRASPDGGHLKEALHEQRVSFRVARARAAEVLKSSPQLAIVGRVSGGAGEDGEGPNTGKDGFFFGDDPGSRARTHPVSIPFREGADALGGFLCEEAVLFVRVGSADRAPIQVPISDVFATRKVDNRAVPFGAGNKAGGVAV